MNHADSSLRINSVRRRVSPSVGLTILEVIRSQDRPEEVLQDEDVSITMPRRLGLSDVIETQIRRYRDQVRRRHKMSDDELRDLIGLVIRRPDAEEVFVAVGSKLAEGDPRQVSSHLPRRLAYAIARRRVKRRLSGLFGRSIVRFGAGPFSIEGDHVLFLWADPGGAACAIVSGLAETILAGSLGQPARLVHSECRGLGADRCGWRILEASSEPLPGSEVSPQPVMDRAAEAG